MARKLWCSLIFSLLFYSLIFNNGFAAAYKGLTSVPQPTTCIASNFSKTGNVYWSTVSLKLTNACGSPVDLQNSTITFNNADNLNTLAWGEFGPITYPDNPLQITSQAVGTQYLASLSLHIPVGSWANSILPDGQSITLTYGTDKPTYDPLSAKVYLNGTPPAQTAEIDLTNTSAQPAGLNQNYAVVDIVNNGLIITKANLPWSGQQAITGLSPGTYNIQPENVTDTQGNIYQGSGTPNVVTVAAGQKTSSVIQYSLLSQVGSIGFTVSPLPNELTGYTSNPQITLTRNDTKGTTSAALAWNMTTTVSKLANAVTYTFSSPVITYKNAQCTPTFNPTSATSTTKTPPIVILNYTCTVTKQDIVSLNVTGLPNNQSSVTITLTPNDGSAPINQTVSVSNGQGNSSVNLNDGTVYNVSATNVSGYVATFNPQPFTARANAIENITYQPQQQPSGGGRIIGYLTGWKTPPAATDLASAGYTHMLVAFGVFSTSQPGTIVPAFDTISTSYIASLHAAGIKVLLSLGGASSGIANTTIDFHQALTLAADPTTFAQTFVQSVEQTVAKYGFDGIDIDIESGLNAGGTFSNPTGDIAVLANIINKLHADNPSLLISLVPQADNIAATSSFSSSRANYSSLIMQTAPALSWVGIQIYNTGCDFGIDGICYDPANTNNPDASVAFATDLLESWPTNTVNHFLPYISYLNPAQVVIGYPAPNGSGAADANPITPTATIKRAIQCLRTGTISATSCQTYKAPRAYPGIGGVFEWEVSFDQSNNYNFAKDLRACVISSNCN